MDALLSIFLSWQFIIFCLGLAGMGFVFRKLIEYFILDMELNTKPKTQYKKKNKNVKKF